MSDSPTLHAFVFCWPKWESAAHRIAEAVAGQVDHLTVLFKNDTGQDETGPGEWRRIPSERYYGWQFRESLELNRGDVMLHIQADASFGDWPKLVGGCREAFWSKPGIGVWSPDVYHSWYTPRLTQVSTKKDETLVSVTITDGVVWALSRPVVEAMERLDYSRNNFGWGLTETAAAVAMTNGLAVMMDLSLPVAHPKGSGYNRDKALEESRAFTGQLSLAQQNYIRTSHAVAWARNKRRVKLIQPSFWREKLQKPDAART